jgi:hypothetical protein
MCASPALLPAPRLPLPGMLGALPLTRKPAPRTPARRHLPRQVGQMPNEALMSPEEIRAAAETYKELGPGYQDAVIVHSSTR